MRLDPSYAKASRVLAALSTMTATSTALRLSRPLGISLGPLCYASFPLVIPDLSTSPTQRYGVCTIIASDSDLPGLRSSELSTAARSLNVLVFKISINLSRSRRSSLHVLPSSFTAKRNDEEVKVCFYGYTMQLTMLAQSTLAR